MVEGVESITEEGDRCDAFVGCGKQVDKVVGVGVIVVDECDAQGV